MYLLCTGYGLRFYRKHMISLYILFPGLRRNCLKLAPPATILLPTVYASMLTLAHAIKQNPSFMGQEIHVSTSNKYLP